MTGVPVRIERAANRILVGSEARISLKNKIPGAYFRQDQTWSVPLDLETCVMLREYYGERLQIGPGLTAWAREEKARRARAEETATAGDAELLRLSEVAPTLYAATASRTYQRSAIRFVADAEGRDGRRRALIADTVGLGKTTEALGAVLESGAVGPFLVVCPKTAVENAWRPEISKRLPGDEIITLPDGRAKRNAILDALAERSAASLGRTWVVTHPAVVRTQTWWICQELELDVADGMVPCEYRTKYKSGMVQELDCGHPADRRKTVHEHEYPQLFSQPWGAVIADESDQILIRLTGTPNLQRRGMEMLRDLVRPGGCRIAMSGTPFRSKPHQIWSTLNWLDPKRWSSKWNFIGKYWGLGGYSGYEIGAPIEDRDAMLDDELKDVMIRREREQVRGDLPAKLYPDNRTPEDADLPTGIWLDLTPKQRKAYEQIEKEAYAAIEGGDLQPIGILAEMTRLHQFAGATGRLERGEFTPLAEGNKYEWLVEFLRELGGRKLVVASQYTKLLNAFSAGISKEFKGIRYGFVTGEVSGPKRTETIAEFEDDGSDLSLLFLNTKAGGSAITLDAAEIMVVLDETRVDDEQLQLEGRIDNRNPERKIAPRSYYYLRSRGTIDEVIAVKNAAAREAGNKILKPQKEIDFARQVLAMRGRQ
jgi:Zierdtviridae DNA helicase